MTDEILTISEMCERFGVTARALRFYESKELLAPTRVGARRRYGHREQARLKLILRGKRFGFQLEEIRVLLNLYNPAEGNATQLLETYRLAEVHLAEMTEQRGELETRIAELEQEMTRVGQMITPPSEDADQECSAQKRRTMM